ncbi:SRPBCC family protein [Streptomyces iconiensis]|uniref:SRPBCC family protein n=1 Tax=Streptomyces iconiensis TaxID=1384038 RepID=A0ABT6ZZ68_9ACTN|nr:SRPBCC family protein [Streptomyces iconiensis]MDJ1134372.1 SRPBCC family protein [Streptomyces iconiensis]
MGAVDPATADRLKSAAAQLAAAEAERVLMGLGRRLGRTTGMLNDVAEGRSPGFARLALESGRKVVEGKGPVRGALEAGASQLKEKAVEGVKGALDKGGKRKKGGGRKPVVILEHVDVGVPVRDAYDQWTQYQDFSSFAKGVTDVTTADDTTSDWKLKVLWSNRSWQATTTEQVPDQRISWTSQGAKGTTKGVVTFHELTGNLTRVVLVMEYYPKGLFEKTGNIWRAQGRRARLDLKHYARHISLKGEADEGWRGEIRDGEVVVPHEDAVAEEEEERGGSESPHGSQESEEFGEPEEFGESANGEDAYAEDESEAESEPEEAEDDEEDEETEDAEEIEDSEDAEEGAYDEAGEPVEEYAEAGERR